MNKNKRHNLSIQGKPGVVIGVIMTLFILVLNYLLNEYALGEGGIAFLPISFFEILIFGISGLFVFIGYFAIIWTNKKLRRKIGLTGWDKTAKKIRRYFFLHIIIGGLFAFLALKTGNVKLIIPCALAFYGLFCILIHKFSSGNTNILGLFILLQCILTYLIPEAALFILGVSFGGFQVAYGMWYGFLNSRQHNPANN